MIYSIVVDDDSHDDANKEVCTSSEYIKPGIFLGHRES